jgi:succinate dehydrogenase/fumarate reductase flavoprotein subunit
MARLEALGKVISTDILVVGGGIAGLTAAITAKETNPNLDILIVDKATVGWGGKANKGGGNIAYIDPEDGVDNFMRCHVQNQGGYLEDQELLRAFGEESKGNLDRLEKWGVHIFRQSDGSPKFVRWIPNAWWRMALLDQDVTENLARYTRARGTQFIDKVAIIDLLTDGERVVGSIGFNVIDGSCYIIKARATILANGNQNYAIMRRWSSGRGDGIAAAYRAGTLMRNAEFGSFYNWVFADSKEVCQGAEDVLYNAKGQHITKMIRPVLESDLHAKEAAAWWKEMLAGNGPIKANMAENIIDHLSQEAFHSDGVAVRPIATAFWGRTIGKSMAAAKDHGPMQEVLPGFIGEQSPVMVDHQMATSLPGLYAVGDTSGSGSAWAGAVPNPPGRMRGGGLSNAVFSAVRGGPAAANYAATAKEVTVNDNQAEAFKATMFEPLRRSEGISAPELIWEIQNVMSPVGNSIYKHQDRLEGALERILVIKSRLSELTAKDAHYLSACHGARAMVDCAEMFYRTSLERKESRGWHIREDYPNTDNQNYLKWIIIQNRKGEMVISDQPVPIERYPLKP